MCNSLGIPDWVEWMGTESWAQKAIAICYKGKADDPVKYFAAKENQDLRVVKANRTYATLT